MSNNTIKEISAGTGRVAKRAPKGAKVGWIFCGVKVTAIKNGVLYGVGNDKIMGCVPLAYNDGMWAINLPKVCLQSELDTIYYQIGNMLECVNTPAPKGLGLINIAELVCNEERIRTLFEKNLFQCFNPTSSRGKSEKIRLCEKNLAELKKRCIENPEIKNKLLGIAAKTFREIIIRVINLGDKASYFDVFNASFTDAAKYMNEIKCVLRELGFKNAPFVLAAEPNRRTPKSKIQEFKEAVSSNGGAKTAKGKKARKISKGREAINRASTEIKKTSAPRSGGSARTGEIDSARGKLGEGRERMNLEGKGPRRARIPEAPKWPKI